MVHSAGTAGMVLTVQTCVDVNPTRTLPRSWEEAAMRGVPTVSLPVLAMPTTQPIPTLPAHGRRVAPKPRRTSYRLPVWAELTAVIAFTVGGLGIGLAAAEVASSTQPAVRIKIERNPNRVATSVKTPAPLVRPTPSPAPPVEPRR